MQPYTVRVFTSHLRGAGTDANVAINAIGAAGSSGWLELPARQSAFEQGQVRGSHLQFCPGMKMLQVSVDGGTWLKCMHAYAKLLMHTGHTGLDRSQQMNVVIPQHMACIPERAHWQAGCRSNPHLGVSHEDSGLANCFQQAHLLPPSCCALCHTAGGHLHCPAAQHGPPHSPGGALRWQRPAAHLALGKSVPAAAATARAAPAPAAGRTVGVVQRQPLVGCCQGPGVAAASTG